MCFQGLFQGLSLKAKARTNDVTLKAKARTKDLTLKAKARTKDLPTVLKESLRTGPRPRTNITVRNAIVFQNFPQGWSVYTVKGLFEIDEVNDEVLLML